MTDFRKRVSYTFDSPYEKALIRLQSQIVTCRKCPRLVRYREAVAQRRKKEFINFEYWGKPVPGFGDPNARLLVIGLAPAAHGGNRTGRVFTGDGSAKFLIKHLYDAGFASQPSSLTRDDGLKLRDCYIIAALRCVPPDNKPTLKEIERCSIYLEREIELLQNVQVILALGKIGFDSIVRYAKKNFGILGSFKFEHAKRLKIIESFPEIVCSYHPSPRNTNTGKLTNDMFSSILEQIRHSLGKPGSVDSSTVLLPKGISD